MWLLICPNCRWGADFYSIAPDGSLNSCELCGSPTPSYEVKGTEGMEMEEVRPFLFSKLGDLKSVFQAGWHTYTNKRLIDSVLAGIDPFIDRNDIEFHLREEDV